MNSWKCLIPYYLHSCIKNNCGFANFAESCQEIGKTVCYIVAAVIIEKDKILMVQEAKKSCRGKWYLPAGRVELAESLDVSEFFGLIWNYFTALNTRVRICTYVVRCYCTALYKLLSHRLTSTFVHYLSQIFLASSVRVPKWTITSLNCI